MEVAEVTMKKLRSDWEGQMEMFKGKLISKAEMDSVEGTFQEADLRYKTAMERLELLEKGRIRMANVDIDSIIKAPAAGVILSQSVFQGDPVVPLTTYQPGTELCSLADMGSLRFKGTVDEIDVGKIVAGMGAEIQIGALPEAEVEEQVTRIYPKAKKDGNATLFDIEISIRPAAGTMLRAGFSATGSIRIRERRRVLVLPERLIVFENGRRFVEVNDGPDGPVRKVEVQTGLSDGLNIELLSGVKEGDRIVERPPREIK